MVYYAIVERSEIAEAKQATSPIMAFSRTIHCENRELANMTWEAIKAGKSSYTIKDPVIVRSGGGDFDFEIIKPYSEAYKERFGIEAYNERYGKKEGR